MCRWGERSITIILWFGVDVHIIGESWLGKAWSELACNKLKKKWQYHHNM